MYSNAHDYARRAYDDALPDPTGRACSPLKTASQDMCMCVVAAEPYDFDRIM